MTRTFFTDKACFQSDLTLIRRQYINGPNYSRTHEAWVEKQGRNAKAGIKELEEDAVSKGLNKGEGHKVFYT
ncbi:uncharacterized protein BJ212DRAFT_1483254 [Suillus subaureus]|uniref:Uncharacterized protein n=1 Tax=Suillus subaureus TaxID=48587 RepID=A0A9P7JB17_9AGAM|nr:uncharacterized protein BJ212DRAFT_1483254 [Suillus subaureus]KAG1812063.1 hypothetical protein BJ212DRAFT_1483254 [Suillus subaureus]